MKRMKLELAARTEALVAAIGGRAALAADKLTPKATALKSRIAAGDIPLAGLWRGDGPGHGDGPGRRGVELDAAATYLGLSEAALRTRLQSGDTLAEIATAQGRTSAALVAALVAAAKTDLGAKVAEGRITEAQRATILADLQSRIEGAVSGKLDLGRHGGSPATGEAAGAGA